MSSKRTGHRAMQDKGFFFVYDRRPDRRARGRTYDRVAAALSPSQSGWFPAAGTIR